MILEKLSLINFKNYDEAQLEFCSKFNCFVGNNGMGKTNLLDAIHYISFCKSFFNAIDSQNIKHDLPFFAIQAWIQKNGETHEIFCGVKRGHKKQFKHNKKEYERLSEHIGLYPLVMISPSDIELIWDGSEVRRKFMDSIISQYDKVYLEKLIAYNHVLHQRNALLKQFYESRTFDNMSLEIWDEQLVIHGQEIIRIRKHFLEEFIPLFIKNYQFISGSKEEVSLEYDSSIKDISYQTVLLSVLSRDRAVHHTTVGPHRDDLNFKLMGNSLKKFASQGQQKSYLLALKLAQFELIKDKKHTKPLLLLDDIYDKLDETRFKQLIDLVSGDEFGQVFITDTHPDRIQAMFEQNNSEHLIYIVNNGSIEKHGEE
ncbi:MAG: recombination protein RecF [Bacteroidetes bacterium]|jgi:DNA replication and repair protein RecF|nr:recombination protein RecF [Bacteroidota bacterium]MDF2452900.1 recombination protein RecF [Bacteroidota bacterium]